MLQCRCPKLQTLSLVQKLSLTGPKHIVSLTLLDALLDALAESHFMLHEETGVSLAGNEAHLLLPCCSRLQASASCLAPCADSAAVPPTYERMHPFAAELPHSLWLWTPGCRVTKGIVFRSLACFYCWQIILKQSTPESLIRSIRCDRQTQRAYGSWLHCLCTSKL